jgi:hypothetical protein
MALNLVSQFDVENAWFAFQKVRGVRDLDSQEEQLKTAALKRFRAKVQRVQAAADALKDQTEERSEFL